MSAFPSSSRTRSGSSEPGRDSRCHRERGRAGPSPTRSLLPAGSVASTTSRWSGSPPSTSRSRAAGRRGTTPNCPVDQRDRRDQEPYGLGAQSWVTASEVHSVGVGLLPLPAPAPCWLRPAPGRRAGPAGTTRSGRHVSNNGESLDLLPRDHAGGAAPARWGRGSATRTSATRSTSAPTGSRRAPGLTHESSRPSSRPW